MTNDDFLKLEGWQYYPDTPVDRFSYYYAKIFPTDTPCAQNTNKGGVALILKAYRSTFELELRAKKADGVWVNFGLYGMRSTLTDWLNAQVKQLLQAWETIAAKPNIEWKQEYLCEFTDERVRFGAPSLETQVNPDVTDKDLTDALLKHCKASRDQLKA